MILLLNISPYTLYSVGRVAWLQIDPHNLKGKVNPILENLGNSVAVDVVVFSYFLVVMLW